ncbi:MAG: glycosyltransferase family 4 protein [Methylobacterium sp.]|uniref:glycosyltransferase family 4 protein n=1 Tax=Methylobacterium sp. TaxID=409 RepID=UPI0025F43FD1|nr:glycosyltransferase family 4 protein [Methylobacterium sp.]MBX9934158.1 glycosyltransferase family 4 protein [Methylobacterium sp.]
MRRLLNLALRSAPAALAEPVLPVPEPRLHVLMTTDAVGGVWTYSLDLAAALVRRGIRTTLSVLGPPPDESQASRAAAIPGCRVTTMGLPLDWTAFDAAEVREAGNAVGALAWQAGADLVHLHSAALVSDSIPVPVVVVCHSCVATWWEAVEDGPLPDDLAWRRDLVATGLARADALLAPSAAFAEATARAYDLDVRPRVVRNGRDCPASRAASPKPVILTAGRLWDRAKNLAILDRVAASLPVPVFAAGALQGPNGERAAPLHVTTLGRLDEAAMAEQFARRPIFVSLARYEPFGLSVLEAAQAGCPLVLSDIPTFRELWGGVARFVGCDDEADLHRVIIDLLANPERARELGTAARERAGAYSLDALGDGIVEVYRTLLPMQSGEAAA